MSDEVRSYEPTKLSMPAGVPNMDNLARKLTRKQMERMLELYGSTELIDSIADAAGCRLAESMERRIMES